MPGGYGGVGGFYFDPLYLVFTVPAMLLALWAQNRVQGAYKKWSQVRNQQNISGADVARILLPENNMSNVRVELSPGKLSDHYDPSSDVLRLSPDVAQQPTIAAMAIAAHEIGHAEQDRDNYGPLRLRAGIVPLVQVGSSIGYVAFFGGLVAQIPVIAWIGILMFSMSAVFAIITLPVEFDASRRALRMLQERQLVSGDQEYRAAKDVLDAAALTYIAAAAQALSTVLYFVFILMRSNSSRRSGR